ncbi:MAG TPA: signal recognition particle receptor subunit alpha, partial [Pseudomonas sp.]|nr:signal recognition particle receptor subunit alpha [Pseudomonas sp.]
MFGSNDDKKTPAPGASDKPAEKKDLFGWLRKKPQAGSPEQSPAPAQPTPVVNPAPTPAPAPIPAQADAPPAAPVTAPAQPLAALPELPVAQPPVEPVAVVAAVSVAAVQPEVAPSAAVAPLVQAAAVAATAEMAPASPDEASAAPRPSRFRINAGSEVLHAHVELPPLFEEPEVAPVAAAAPSAEETRAGFLERLKQGLAKTSASLGEGMASLFLGKKVIDDELLEDIETRLLTADVGVEATTAIVQNLTKRVARKELADSGALYKALQEELTTLLKPVEQPLKIDSGKQPYVILVVGVNGAGKTTT